MCSVRSRVPVQLWYFTTTETELMGSGHSSSGFIWTQNVSQFYGTCCSKACDSNKEVEKDVRPIGGFLPPSEKLA